MTKRILSIFIILFSTVILFSSCGNPQQLVYQDVKNFRINELSLAPRIGMDIQFYNPNTFGMTLKDADVNLYINGKFVGNGTLERTYTVPATDTFYLPVSLKADLSNVLSNALSLLVNKKVDIELKGNVQAGRIVFVNIPINYKGEQKLDIVEF